VTTLAGSGSPAFLDGVGAGASFGLPHSIAVAPGGVVVVGDNHVFGSTGEFIRFVAPGGVVSSLTGPGLLHNDYVSTAAGKLYFNGFAGIAVDQAGNLLVTEYVNSAVRMVTPAGVLSLVATLPGGGGSAGVTLDAAGVIYAAGGNAIYRILANRSVALLAGGASAGLADGVNTSARFNMPLSLAVDSQGSVYVADTGNNAIRVISASGVVSTLAGGTQGFADGLGSSARFNYPSGLALDSALGTLYVSDGNNHRIRAVSSGGVVTTLAGRGSAAMADGALTTAAFNFPRCIAMSSARVLYVADSLNFRIRAVSLPSLQPPLPLSPPPPVPSPP